MSFASRSASTEKEQHLSDAEFEKINANAALRVQCDEGVEVQGGSGRSSRRKLAYDVLIIATC